MKRLALLLLLAASPAIAETPPHYVLDLTPQEADYIGSLLQNEKLKDSLPLYSKLQVQIRAQQQPKAETPAPAPAKPDEKKD